MTKTETRPYRQAKRAIAKEETANKIAMSLHKLMSAYWLEDITLDMVAEASEVSVQTVLRHFGSKEGLVAALPRRLSLDIAEFFAKSGSTVESVVDSVVGAYEKDGDTIVRSLSQEARHSSLRPLLDHGRRAHRELVSQSFALWIKKCPEKEAASIIDALVLATDIHSWQLLRRSMGRSKRATCKIISTIVKGVFNEHAATSKR